MEVIETKKRTLYKTISWRLVAILNSFLILTVNITNSNFLDRDWETINV